MSVTSHQQIRILHVDDEPDFADLTGTFLEREDDRFTVKTATSADEGQQRINDRPPDCVVSDYNMPGMDGIEFLQAVREEYPDLPFILYTGKGSEAVASEAIAADVTDYLQKGSGSEQYELLVNRILNAVETRREAERADRQEELMRLTEFAGDTGGFELDRESDTIVLTAGTRRMIGRPDKFEISLQEAIELFHPDDREGIQQTLDRVFETGEKLHDRWRLQPGDGDERLLDMQITPVVENGEVTKLRGSGNDITDRKERQRELRLLQTAIDDATVSITLADPSQPDQPLVYVNDAFEELTGHPPEETLGRNCRFLQGEDTDPDKIATLREAIDNEESVTVELRNYRKDGTEFWNRLTVTPIYDDDGQLVRYLGTQEDVTERNERERHLTELDQASQDLLRADTKKEIADIGVRAAREILDLKSNAIHLSEADDTQLTPVAQTDELVSLLGDVYPLPVADSIAGRIYQRGEPTVIEDVRQDPNVHNPETDLRGHVYLPLADHGILIAASEERAAFNQHDIAFSKQLARNLVAALDRIEPERELREERRFIRQSLNALNDLFYVLDTDGCLRQWNDRAAEVTGYTDSELDGMLAIDLFLEDERETIADAIGTTLADGQVTVEADLRTADGERLPCKFTGAQLTDEDGTVTGLVGIGRDLTERRQRERRLNALLGHSTDRISVTDAEGCYTFVSPSVERLFGHDPAELVGESAFDYIHPEVRADTRATFEQILNDPDGVYSVEYRYRDDGGSWQWVESRGTNRLDDPAIDGIVINSREITERKQREQELERTHDLLSNMEELADVGAWEYDSETDRLMLTDGTRRIHGLDAGADFTLEAAFETFHPDDRDLLRDRFDTCLETGQPYEMDVRLTTPDGEQRWITTRGERMTDGGSGDVVRGYIQDITESKGREQRLDLVETLFEHAEECQFIVDVADGEFELRHANQYYKRTVGLPANTPVTGQTPVELFGETGGRQILDQYRRCVETQNSVSYTVEVPVPEAGTVYRTILTPVTTNGEVTRIVGTARDITDRVEQEQELQQKTDRLNEFASIVSHDLRSPLSVAEGHLELAAETCESDHLARATDAIDRSQALIDDLLALAREGDRVDETEPVEIAAVVESSWQTVETRQATLDADAPQVIEADRSRLQQLSENLYRNAVEHGGDDVIVSVGAIDDGFYVADTGPGIPESDREDVFEAGYSTNEDGTGFGLQIVEQIASAHGWEITVTESEAGGARFEVTGVEFADR